MTFRITPTLHGNYYPPEEFTIYHWIYRIRSFIIIYPTTATCIVDVTGSRPHCLHLPGTWTLLFLIDSKSFFFSLNKQFFKCVTAASLTGCLENGSRWSGFPQTARLTWCWWCSNARRGCVATWTYRRRSWWSLHIVHLTECSKTEYSCLLFIFFTREAKVKLNVLENGFLTRSFLKVIFRRCMRYKYIFFMKKKLLCNVYDIFVKL